MTIKWAIVDANERLLPEDDRYHELVSVVGQWLEWEMEQLGVPIVPIEQANAIFLVHSGELDWRTSCSNALSKLQIEPMASKRNRRPYIIAGGGVDTVPFTAIKIADAVAIGEAYQFVRSVLKIGSIQEIQDFVVAYPHAIERSQIEGFQRDSERPYLLRDVPPILATPDAYVDWTNTPATTSDDGVTRIVASKGCHLKCQFCATTYRQTYRKHEQPDALIQQMQDIKASKGRVSLITNDAADLPFFADVVAQGQLQFQSVTIKALRDPQVLETFLANRMKILRFGVEGISERIRRGFGKYISNEELMSIIEQFNARNQALHIFYIVGAPYESEADWDDFLYGFLSPLSNKLTHGTVRIKTTAFNPQSPTPLVYFAPGDMYAEACRRAVQYVVGKRSKIQKHLIFVPPRQPKQRLIDFADTFSISQIEAMRWMRSGAATIDLAPTLDDARRMPFEVVGWNIDVERRWRLSRSYQKRMLDMSNIRF